MPIQMTREQYQQILAKRQEQGGTTGGVGNAQPQQRSPSSNMWSTVTEPPKQPGFFGSLVKGVADIALQPARFLEKAGKQIGEIGLTEEQKQKFESYMGPGIQERFAKDVGLSEETQKDLSTTRAYRTGKETLGGALQAGANLATPFVGGIGGMTLQSAALAGGKTLEEGGTAGEALMSGAIGGATGAVLGKAGEAIGKGLSTGFKGIIENVGRIGRGLTKAEMGTIKTVPKITEGYYQKLVGAGDDLVKQQQARQEIEEGIFDTARDVWNTYTKKAADQFNKDMVAHAKVNLRPDAPKISRGELVDDLKSLAEDMDGNAQIFQGKFVTEGGVESERAMLGRLYAKIKKSIGEDSITGELGFSGLDKLRRDIGELYDSAHSGTPEKAMLDNFYGNLKKRMSEMTKDPEALQATFDAYRQMLEEKSVFKKLTSNKSDPAAVRQGYLELTRALTGQKGTGEMAKSVASAEEAAGLKPNELAYRLQALDLASKLSGTRNVATTERMLETGIKGAESGKVPESLTGLGIKAVGYGAKKLLDKKFMRNLFQEAGVKVGPSKLASLGKIIENPKTAQVLFRALQEFFQSGDQSIPQDFGSSPQIPPQ